MTAIAAPAASAQTPTRLPVYDVQASGATQAQATRLAKALGLSARLLGEHGILSFIDQDRFGALPVKPVTAPGATRPNEEEREVIAQAPDLEAIRAIKPMPAGAARREASAALKAARLTTGGPGRVTFSEFESVDANGQDGRVAAGRRR